MFLLHQKNNKLILLALANAETQAHIGSKRGEGIKMRLLFFFIFLFLFKINSLHQKKAYIITKGQTEGKGEQKKLLVKTHNQKEHEKVAGRHRSHDVCVYREMKQDCQGVTSSRPVVREGIKS